MDDLGSGAAMPGAIMLGGGNPSRIPAVEELFHARMEEMLQQGEFDDLVGAYDGPGGNAAFIGRLADLLRRTYGWEIGPEHIALTNGSQTAFFFLFNMFAGAYPGGVQKKILLPLAPEYIGYADVGIGPDLFVSQRPTIEHHADRTFKYRVDFDALHITDEIGAICVSRPTNPTGNVLTEEEMAQLSALAKEHGIPFIVDNAYGMPFPGIIYTEAVPAWEPHIIMCMSLSKLGLPGARTGMVIADPEVIRAITGMNAVISLAPGGLGARLAEDAVRSGAILEMSREIIMPHYRRKLQSALGWLHRGLAGVDYHIHSPEGAFFLWLWFRDLPITCQELYRRLKARKVLVVPGHYFFPGLAGDWRHMHECIRMNYAGAPEQVETGIAIIAEEVHGAYRDG